MHKLGALALVFVGIAAFFWILSGCEVTPDSSNTREVAHVTETETERLICAVITGGANRYALSCVAKPLPRPVACESFRQLDFEVE
jgi:hypothetical protein